MAPHSTDSSPLISDRTHGGAAPTTKITSFSQGLIYALAASRLAVGALAILAPETTARLFKVDTLPGATLLTRLFGSREAAVGCLTVATCSKHESKTELRRVLWTGVAIDAMDVVACFMVLISSNTTEAAAAKTTFGVGLGAVLLGLFTIRSVN